MRVIALFLILVSSAHAKLNIEHWKTPEGARVLFAQTKGLPMLDVQLNFDPTRRHMLKNRDHPDPSKKNPPCGFIHFFILNKFPPHPLPGQKEFDKQLFLKTHHV